MVPSRTAREGSPAKYVRPAIGALIALAAGVLAATHVQTPLLALDMPDLPTGALSSSVADGVCVMPWVADGDETLGPEDYWGLDPTELYAVPMSHFATEGTFRTFALYGPSAVDYRDSITTPCAGGDRGACDQPDPHVWIGETLTCDSFTGIISNVTDHALEARYGQGTDCDALTYDEASTLAGTELCQDRAVFIAIIDAFPPPGSSGLIEILGIETFYIAGWDRFPPYGDEDIDGDTVPDFAVAWGYFLFNFNQPPECSSAAPSITEIWPANHKMVSVNILGVTDPDGDSIGIAITHITQDEPVNALGDAHSFPDGAGVGTNTALVRAERAETRNPTGDGRMYHIHFEATDGKGGVCFGLVNVGVPRDRRPGGVIVNGGELYDSTLP